MRPRFLAPHPSGLLTQDPDVRARLTRFGLRRIGAVAGLDRTRAGRPLRRGGRPDPRPGAWRGARAVPPALGPRTPPARPADRARGRGPRAAPLRPPSTGRRPDRRSSSPVASPASRARLHLDLDLAFARAGTLPSWTSSNGFPEPTADAEAIERLLFARLERTPPPAAVARLSLELDGTTPAAGQQLPLFTPQAARGARLELAAGSSRADLRGGPGPAGGAGRPGGAAARGRAGPGSEASVAR